MKPIERSDILSLGEYERIRNHFRTRVIDAKRVRRMRLGPEMSLLFENRDTVLLQIQEMLRTERITSESGIAHEVATYNELVPADHELSATLFIEVADASRRDEALTRLCAIEEHVELVVGGERTRATFEAGRRHEGRAAAVQYLKFPLPPAFEGALRERRTPAFVRLDHPAFAITAGAAPTWPIFELPKAMLASLAEDLA